MENLVFTQLSIPEVKQLFRQEIENYFDGKNFAYHALPETERLLSLEEAAEFVKLSNASLYRLCGEKKIPHIKQKGRFLFSTKELLQWAKDGKRKNYKEIAADADKKLADFKAGHKQKVA